MKIQLKFAVISLVFIPMVVFLAYNSLSASSPPREPFAAFSAVREEPAADFIPAPVVKAPEVAWVNAVRGVLDQVEKLENRLEEYSAQLDAIEKDAAPERMAEQLGLDETNPGLALEALVTRFDKMIGAYSALGDASKAELAELDAAGKVAALTAAAAEEEKLNAYFDGLAARRAAYVEEQRARDLAVCEALIAVEAAGRSAMKGVLAESLAAGACNKAVENAVKALEPCAKGADGARNQSPPEKLPAPERETGK